MRHRVEAAAVAERRAAGRARGAGARRDVAGRVERRGVELPRREPAQPGPGRSRSPRARGDRGDDVLRRRRGGPPAGGAGGLRRRPASRQRPRVPGDVRRRPRRGAADARLAWDRRALAGDDRLSATIAQRSAFLATSRLRGREAIEWVARADALDPGRSRERASARAVARARARASSAAVPTRMPRWTAGSTIRRRRASGPASCSWRSRASCCSPTATSRRRARRSRRRRAESLSEGLLVVVGALTVRAHPRRVPGGRLGQRRGRRPSARSRSRSSPRIAG